MNITVKVKNVYGQDLIYPADDNAQRFAQLTGKKTFTKYDLRLIKELGYEVKQEAIAL